MRQLTRDDVTKQRELEAHMGAEGRARANRQWGTASKRGDIADNPTMKKLVNRHLHAFSKIIAQYIKDGTSGKAGRKAGVAVLLKGHDPDLLAYLTCRYVINGVTLQYTLTAVEKALGSAIEDEVRLAEFAKANKGAVKWTQEQIKKRKVVRTDKKRGFMLKVAEHKGMNWEPWTQAQKVQIGAVLVHLFCSCTDLAKTVTVRKRGKTVSKLEATPITDKWITKAKAALIRPLRTPMVVPPQRWTSLNDGGYLGVEMPLVSSLGWRYGTNDIDAMSYLEGTDLSRVSDALSALDNTKYAINTRVLDVVKAHVNAGSTLGSLPSCVMQPKPVCPEHLRTAEMKQQRYDWSKQARAIHEANAEAKASGLLIKRILFLADEYVKHGAFYFPHQLDFRGRVYSMATDLNPQGPDYVRGLLHFADGKAVTNDAALKWLMIHGANCYGYDKVTLEDRVAWVRDHADEIAQTYHDPYGCKWWHKASKPFCFLAWVFDFIDVIEHGKPSYIRVAMDGSCNGLQHFAAMTRDPVAAKAVNLADNATPQDIYGMVAAHVTAKLEKCTKEKRWMAEEWLRIKVDRSLCKRSVMVMPYGGTRHSTMKYVEEELKDREHNFGDEAPKAVSMLAMMIYDSTREIVTGGKIVMEWLQKVAQVAANADVHVKWTTPIGFVAQQQYRKMAMQKVQTFLNGRGSVVSASIIQNATMDIDKSRSANGISPNFVHSLDASAMMLTLNDCVKKGVTHFHMIHDDYGTHAADTPLLAQVLREQFVQMYEKHNVLAEFRAEVLSQLPKEFHKDVPKVPRKGKFNIREVLNSDFFFA